MELIHRLTEVVQSGVLEPGLDTAMWVFLYAFVSEVIAILPGTTVLAAPLLFLDGALTFSLLGKLFFYIAIPFGIGDVLGSLPIYGISYWGGKPAIERFHKYLRFSWKDVERIERRFKGLWYDEIFFLILRSVPFLPTLPVNIAAGILRMRLLPYMMLTLVGMIIRLMITFWLASLGAESLFI